MKNFSEIKPILDSQNLFEYLCDNIVPNGEFEISFTVNLQVQKKGEILKKIIFTVKNTAWQKGKKQTKKGLINQTCHWAQY